MRKLSSGVLWLLLALLILVLALVARQVPIPADVPGAATATIPGKATGPDIREAIRAMGDTEANALEY